MLKIFSSLFVFQYQKIKKLNRQCTIIFNFATSKFLEDGIQFYGN